MSRMRLSVTALAVMLAACSSEPQVGSVTLSVTTVSLDAIGDTRQLTATVRDQDDQIMTGQTVTWSSSSTGVATVSESGLVTAVANGTASVTATVGSQSSAPANVTVQQVTATLSKAGGDAQTGVVATALASALQVSAVDRLGQAVNGATVTFAVTAGGGALSAASAITSGGAASTSWTLGTVAGAVQTVSATVGTVSTSFSATATAGGPDSLVMVDGDDQVATPGSGLPDSLVVRVADRFGNPVAGAAIAWVVTSGGGSVSPAAVNTAADGQAATAWTLGTVGPQTATASNDAVTVGSPVEFSADAQLASMTGNDGDGQDATVGTATTVAPSVIVLTPGGDPVAGVTVTFAVTGGGGSLTGATQLTNASGIARVGSWTVGATPGANTLEATTTDPGVQGGPVTFTVNGMTSGYDIVLRHLTTMTASVRVAFDSAEKRWQRAVVGDLSNVSGVIPATTCSGVFSIPETDETRDDLIIYTRVEAIDGPGGTIAQAAPCYVRTSNGLTVIGWMRFDEADLATFEATGRLEAVVLHEMGHVLGIGSLWGEFEFLQNPSLPDNPGADTHFNGPQAIAAFDALGGTNYTGGAKVPVENDGAFGPGTRDGHWRESVFDHELLTGIVEAAGVAMPLSSMTIASLADLGYVVDTTTADAYNHTFSAPPAMAAQPRVGEIVLANDLVRGTLYVVDEKARVIRVIQR